MNHEESTSKSDEPQVEHAHAPSDASASAHSDLAGQASPTDAFAKSDAGEAVESDTPRDEPLGNLPVTEEDEDDGMAAAPAAPSKRRGKPISEEEVVDLSLATPENRHWYIVKVQSNREDSIRRNLIRKIRIADKEAFFGDIVVPTEKVTEVRSGKKRVLRRKLYPGYVMINMELNEETLFLIRDTAGIGEFTGSGGKPIPMAPHEVERILAKQEDRNDTAPRLQIPFKEGDRVKINEGTFHDIEGEVGSIDPSNGHVTVMINIFGRSTPVELEYWQVELI